VCADIVANASRNKRHGIKARRKRTAAGSSSATGKILQECPPHSSIINKYINKDCSAAFRRVNTSVDAFFVRTKTGRKGTTSREIPELPASLLRIGVMRPRPLPAVLRSFLARGSFTCPPLLPLFALRVVNGARSTVDDCAVRANGALEVVLRIELDVDEAFKFAVRVPPETNRFNGTFGEQVPNRGFLRLPVEVAHVRRGGSLDFLTLPDQL